MENSLNIEMHENEVEELEKLLHDESSSLLYSDTFQMENSLNIEMYENEVEELEKLSHDESSSVLYSDNLHNTSRENLLSCSEISPHCEEHSLNIKTTKNSKRLHWADILRIFSTLAIVFLHCSGYGLEQSLRKKKNKQWKIICWYNCITRFGVPMFVLLSGTFILDPSKDLSFKKLFRHNIFHLITAFSFWSTVNAFMNIFVYKTHSLSQFFELFFVGEQYLWFIFMIIGCYLISPILRLFSDNVLITRYFLVLCIFWGSFIPTLNNIFTILKLTRAKEIMQSWTKNWHFHFTLEFVGYFVAGYHIVKHVHINSYFHRIILYLLAIADVVVYSYLTYQIEINNHNKYSKEFRDAYSLSIVFYSVVLFIFFKYEIGRISFSRRTIAIINKLSSLSFGVYLIHMIIKRFLITKAKISQERFLFIKFSPIIGCPIFWVIVTLLSLIACYCLSKISLFRKYLM